MTTKTIRCTIHTEAMPFAGWTDEWEKHSGCELEYWCEFHRQWEDSDTVWNHCQHCGGPNH